MLDNVSVAYESTSVTKNIQKDNWCNLYSYTFEHKMQDKPKQN